MEDHNFTVVRKNLNIISVLILLLAFSKAEVNNINFLGIDLQFDGPKLYTGLYILYIYFIWRFLTKLPLKSGFMVAFQGYFLDSENGIKKEYSFERMRSRLMEAEPRLEAILSKKQLAPVELTFRRLPHHRKNELRLFARCQYFASEDEQNRQHADFGAYIDFRFSRLLRIKKLLWFSFKHDQFGDYLFPVVPIIANLILFFLQGEWQGGFKRLVLSCL